MFICVYNTKLYNSRNMANNGNNTIKLVINRTNVGIDNLFHDLESLNTGNQHIPPNKVTETQPRTDQLLDGQKLQYLEDPTQDDWCLLPMYNIDQNQNTRIWQIGYDFSTQELITIHGVSGGKLQTERRKIVINQTNDTFLKKALVDARKSHLNKRRQGYRSIGEAHASRMKCQLAGHFCPPGWESRHSSETRNLKYPVMVDPKLDGVRATAWLELEGGLNGYSNSKSNPDSPDVVGLYTRENVPYYFMNPHREELQNFMTFLPLGYGLDGEFYNHDIEFNKVSGLCRKKTPTEDDFKEMEKIQYFIFDIMVPNQVLEERYTTLIKAYQHYLEEYGEPIYFQLIRKFVAHNLKDILNYHGKFVEMGYEGTMIRRLYSSNQNKTGFTASCYRSGRNISLLKFKDDEEEEVTIIGVTSGSGRETGKAMFKVIDANEIKFPVRPKGTFEQRSEWYQNPQLVIGRLYTIKFQEKFPNGKPRFAVGKAFRDNSSMKGKKDY